MDPTTLVTFTYGAAPDVHTVELLGSWDNFEQPYRMHHDRRRGTGFWSGCFKFKNIIFDGDSFHRTKPRNGGLKQGGVYWYFYRLNYDEEVHDHCQLSTTFCPLLPGQIVNVIDVPLEIVELPARCQSAYGEIVGNLSSWRKSQELDPTSKFAMLEPPPMSKVHCRAVSDCALNGRLENLPVVVIEEPVSPLDPVCLEQLNNLNLDEGPPQRDGVSSASSVYSQCSLKLHSHSQIDDQEQHGKDRMQRPHNAVCSGPLPSLEELTVSTFTPVASKVVRSDSSFTAITPSRESKSSKAPASNHNVKGDRMMQRDDLSKHHPLAVSMPISHELDHCAEARPSRSPVSSIAHSPTNLPCSNLDSPRPHNHMDDFDFGLVSPSFSASTVSSDDGHDSPGYFSSAGTPPHMPEHHPPALQEQQVEQQRPSSNHTPPSPPVSRRGTERRPGTASRFASLTNRIRHRASPPPSLPIAPRHQQAPPHLNFAMNYSLPHLAAESANASTKTLPIIPRPHHADDPFVASPIISSSLEMTLPAIVSSQSGEGESMAEAILAELGF